MTQLDFLEQLETNIIEFPEQTVSGDSSLAEVLGNVEAEIERLKRMQRKISALLILVDSEIEQLNKLR